MFLNLIGQTAAEDFSFYGEKAPTFFFSLGGMEKGKKQVK
jgi:metal-dependent amidase/aminoacylase/carboxypeptidase family protein